jgi:hypothetical protein
MELPDYGAMEVTEIIGIVKRLNRNISKWEKNLLDTKIEVGYALLALEDKLSVRKFRQYLNDLPVKPITSRKYMKYAENGHLLTECSTVQEAEEKLKMQDPTKVTYQTDRNWTSFRKRLTKVHDAILAELEETGDSKKINEALKEADNFSTHLRRLRKDLMRVA